MPLLNDNHLEQIWDACKSAFADINHFHLKATASADGMMSATDKKKLDGIATGADKTNLRQMAYSIPVSAWTGSGPYTATISDSRITANTDIQAVVPTTATEQNHVSFDFETSVGQIKLSATFKPSGEMAGIMKLQEVTG